MSMLRARLERLKGIKPSQAELPDQIHEADQASAAEHVQDRDSSQKHAPATVEGMDGRVSDIAVVTSTSMSAGVGMTADSTELLSGESGRFSKTECLLKLSPVQQDEAFANTWDKLHVQLAEHEYGTFLLRTRRYRGDEAIGMHPYEHWKQTSIHLNAFYPDQAADAEQFLFLDLETTGLGSGTGNIPFMVGLAYWEDESIVVQQALIRHPAEERAMLAYLHQLTAQFTHLVTYNGKSFDWPLLHSRYMLNGMRETVWQPLHVDLLHPSRALWRNTLESCKLSHIEKMRLGIIRIDDLPGSEAPTRYFQFLASGDPSVLVDVYKHNEIDMLSLVTLAIRFGHLLSNEDVTNIVQQPCEPEELVRTGLWLEKMGRYQYSKQLFQLAVHIPEQSSQTLMMLAMRDKKMNDYDRAIMLWERIVAATSILVNRTQVEAAIELSMYYEHKAKQHMEALHYANIANELQHQLHSVTKKGSKQRDKELADLNKRLERIKKKCSLTI